MPPLDTVFLHGPAAVVPYEAMREILQQPGANPNHRDALGRTPGHVAGIGGNAGALRALAEAGADFTVKDHVQGATALHNAIGGDYIEATAIILENGGDLEATDKEGLTPEDYGRRNNAEKALAEVRAFQADGGTTLERDPHQAGMMPAM